MCYNVSVVSVEVRGITDLDALADVLCPESGDILGQLSLRETLMKYLKLKDGNPMVAELHQRGPQGPVDMVISNTSKVDRHFEMVNKQLAGYLYHVLPLFKATDTFIKTILRRSMDAGLATEAPRCKYNKETQILMTPRNAQQESILSNVRSLPFFQDIDVIKQAAGAKKKGKKKEHTAPKMCFQIGSARTVQTVHGANNEKYTNITKPGVKLGADTQASVATKLNVKQPAVEIDSPDDDTSSGEGSEGGSDKTSSSDKTFPSASSDEDEQSEGPAGSG
jgi:hypothetical protein